MIQDWYQYFINALIVRSRKSKGIFSSYQVKGGIPCILLNQAKNNRC
jgi:hypothetical protein